MQLPQRKIIRAQRYDYASSGVYFVTICTKNRTHYFGEIKNGKMIFSSIGSICEQELHVMMNKRPLVALDEYVIMPNHVHILLIVDPRRDVGLPCPNEDAKYMDNASVVRTGADVLPRPNHIPMPYPNHIPMPGQHHIAYVNADNASVVRTDRQSLGSIIGGWKSAVSKKCHAKGYGFARQGRYHDHIIRNVQEYERIKCYIQHNPKNWNNDNFYA